MRWWQMGTRGQFGESNRTDRGLVGKRSADVRKVPVDDDSHVQQPCPTAVSNSPIDIDKR